MGHFPLIERHVSEWGLLGQGDVVSGHMDLLDVESLDVNDEISPAVAGFNLRFHTIARAVMIPVYGH